jgi:archaemetzincin
MNNQEKILLIILSNIDENLIQALKRRLEQTFKRTVTTRYAIQNLAYAYDKSRKQFISPRLIARLRRIKRQPGDKILGVTDVDLYSPEYDFVYGEAEMASGVATLSIFRLKDRNNGNSPQVLEERAVREAVHELGHLYQLGHCSNSRCVMRACPCIADVDKAGHEFCEECSADLKTTWLHQSHDARTGI